MNKNGVHEKTTMPNEKILARLFALNQEQANG